MHKNEDIVVTQRLIRIVIFVKYYGKNNGSCYTTYIFSFYCKKLSSILHAHLKYTMKYVAKRKAKLQKENSICWYKFFTFNKYMYSSLCNRQLFVDQGFVKGGNGQFTLCQAGQSCFSLSKGQIVRIWHLQCCIISIIAKSRKTIHWVFNIAQVCLNNLTDEFNIINQLL